MSSDIVEALQVLQCMIKRYLIFHKSALVDDDRTDVLQDEDSGIKKQSQLGLAQDEGSWDGILANRGTG
jgi:hypothetical protein